MARSVLQWANMLEVCVMFEQEEFLEFISSYADSIITTGNIDLDNPQNQGFRKRLMEQKAKEIYTRTVGYLYEKTRRENVAIKPHELRFLRYSENQFAEVIKEYKPQVQSA